MSHTRGPWHRNIRAGGKYPVVFAGRCQHVATVCQQATPEETEANIDLIHAAPELLEALQKAADTFDELEKGLRLLGKQITAHGCAIASEGCKAAIAKATSAQGSGS